MSRNVGPMQPLRLNSRQPSVARKLNATEDIIVISDDDEPLIRRKTNSSNVANHTRAGKKRKGTPLTHDGSIISLDSSDNEDSGAGSKTGQSDRELTKLQKKIHQLQNDIRREKESAKRQLDDLRKEMAVVAEENMELKRSTKTGQGSLIDASQLEDKISCQICTVPMWTPYILPECGHVFCQSCLDDWFSTTLAQHMTTHPNYVLNPPLPLQIRQIAAQVVSRPELRPHLNALVAQYRLTQLHAQPAYTCPGCRREVKNKPVEDYVLKDVVRTVTSAMGESSPKKQRQVRSADGTVGPWDGYFGSGWGS